MCHIICSEPNSPTFGWGIPHYFFSQSGLQNPHNGENSPLLDTLKRIGLTSAEELSSTPSAPPSSPTQASSLKARNQFSSKQSPSAVYFLHRATQIL